MIRARLYGILVRGTYRQDSTVQYKKKHKPSCLNHKATN